MINVQFIYISEIYFKILLVQCYYINNLMECAFIPTREMLANLAHRYVSRKTAFIEAFPPRVDYNWGINGLSKTFETNKSVPDSHTRVHRLFKKYIYRPVSNTSRLDKEVLNELLKVKIICWVLTHPNNHYTKAFHVKRTWGKRCNKLIFFSTIDDEILPSVKLDDVKESRLFLWGKTKEALKYLYKHHLYDADWFMKADDDTYVIVENLRKILFKYNSTNPYYIGCVFGDGSLTKYMFGGAGYVLSRAALYNVVKLGFGELSPQCNPSDKGDEDYELGKCLYKIGINISDTRDSYDLERFLPDTPFNHLSASDKSWFWKFMHSPELIHWNIKPKKLGTSDSAVSFHHISPHEMYIFEYLLYHLGPRIMYGQDFEDSSDTMKPYHILFFLKN